MRRFLTVILTLAVVLQLCSCSVTGVTLNVCAQYSGYGYAGNGPGSGEMEYKLKHLKTGDVIYERFNGELTTEIDPDAADRLWFIKIGKITKEGVEVEVRHGDYSLGFDRGETGYLLEYGEEFRINSLFYMADGINYTYIIKFGY